MFAGVSSSAMKVFQRFNGLREQDLIEAKDLLLVETSDMLRVPLFTAEALLRNHGRSWKAIPPSLVRKKHFRMVSGRALECLESGSGRMLRSMRGPAAAGIDTVGHGGWNHSVSPDAAVS